MSQDDCPNCHEGPGHADDCGYVEFLQKHPDGIGTANNLTDEEGTDWVRGHLSLEDAIQETGYYTVEDLAPDELPALRRVWLRCIGRTRDVDELYIDCAEDDFGAVPFTELEF